LEIKQKKIIEGQNKCIDNCSIISYYEYNSICYSECPEDKFFLSKKYLCINNSNINNDNINSDDINHDNINNKKALYEIIKEKFNNNPSLLSGIYQDLVNSFIEDIKNGNFDN